MSLNLLTYLKAERGRTNSVAAKLGISAEYLSQIANGKRACPIHRAPDIEAACEFQVPRKELRPNDWHKVWPELIDEPNEGGRHARNNARHMAADHHNNNGRRGVDMRTHLTLGRATATHSATAPPHPQVRQHEHSAPASLEPLHDAVLRMAAEAAFTACRKQRDLSPQAAAMAVIEAYEAARKRLQQMGSVLAGVPAPTPPTLPK